MNQTVLITLIIVVAILVVLWLYRDRLTAFFFKAGKDGLEAELKAGHQGEERAATQPPTAPSLVVRGNRQQGNSNVIDLRRDSADVSDNVQEGDKNKLALGPDKPK